MPVTSNMWRRVDFDGMVSRRMPVRLGAAKSPVLAGGTTNRSIYYGAYHMVLVPDAVLIEPPEYHTVTHVLPIWTEAGFGDIYDGYAEVCRAIYNRAVHEAEFDGPERLTYAPYLPNEKKNEKGEVVKGPYLDRKTLKLAKKVAKKTGMSVEEIRDGVRAQLGGMVWYHGFPPNSRDTRNRIGLLLTKWRAENEWMRECPVLYGRGAIHNAVTAVDRSVSDNSDKIPVRGRGKRAALFCPNGQDVNRKGPRELQVPGFLLHTKQHIPKEWDIRSCQIVETTPYRTRMTGRGRRTFAVHVQVREAVKQPPTNVLARGVDLGAKHIAATADTTGLTTLQTMRHTDTWREIRALQSKRDNCRKGSHAWLKYDKLMRIKREKANNIAKNARLQGAAFISHGVCYVVIEILRLKAMMAAGGNRKRRLNDMLALAGLGGFRGQIIRDAARRGIPIILVDAGDTSNECALCAYVSKESRITRDDFVCVKCGDESHADINAGCVILKRGISCLVDRAEGQPVLRRRSDRRNQPTRQPDWSRMRRGFGPPVRHARWGRQKITGLELLPRL